MPSPRRLVIGFLLGALLVVAAAPALNLWRRGGLPGSASTLFEIDFQFLDAGDVLRRVGISTLPRQVIVGKAGWLFLGDQYAQTISVKRRAANAADRDAAQRIAAAARAWQRWLETRGVRNYWVLICADKDSIFPDHLPDWDRLANGSAMDVMMTRADPRQVIDSRSALRLERGVDGLPLYTRTDSHWTARGAWVAYRALAQASASKTPALAWLQDTDIRIAPLDLPQGDLAHLLHSADSALDQGARVEFVYAHDAGRTQRDAVSGDPLSAGPLTMAQPLRRAVRIVSPHALNRRRLLWLQDSFGAALLPFMAATFDDVIQVDRATTTPAQWAALVASVRPDAILVSVVERNARSEWFEALPPASAQ